MMLLSKTTHPFMITKGTPPSFRCWYYLWHLWGKQKCHDSEVSICRDSGECMGNGNTFETRNLTKGTGKHLHHMGL